MTRSLCVVSTNDWQCTGGLAAYQRCLLRHISSMWNVSSVARFAREGPHHLDYAARQTARSVVTEGWQNHIIAPGPVYVPFLSRLRRLLSRRKLQPVAVSLFVRAYRPALGRAFASQPCVVHYVGAGWELLGFAALAEARRIGAAFSVCPAVHPGTWGDSTLDIELYRQADVVFALSKHERDHLASLGVPDARLVVTGLGPAVDAVGCGQDFRRRHGLGTRPVVLFIGRKQVYKGYHTLCRSMRQVMTIHPDVCLVAVGPWGEPPYPHLDPSALLDLQGASEQEKADALAGCDVFCMPSSGESFGIGYVEAWAHAKPVVAGPAPAVRELVSDGVNGFCVEQSQEQIASILIQLLSDADLRQRLGSNGRQLQQSRFSWEKVAQLHSDVFTQVRQSAKASD